MQFRDLKKQYQALKPRIDEAVIGVMQDTNFISGAQVTALEKRLADYVGVKHCITCANGTDALKLAEIALGIGPGDAVFIPDFTFFASAETIADLGATPVFVDVDPHTFNISPEALELAVKKVCKDGYLKPKAIVAVDLFGLPANFPEIYEISKKYGLLVIEDGAQGFGGSIWGKMACSFGDIATTSFFPAKPLGCYGDGGAVFTNDDVVAELIRSLCVHGKSGQDKYDNVRIGMNSRLDTIQAAILDIKLSAFVDYELDAVNRVASAYDAKLPAGIAKPIIPENFYSSWAQYTVKLQDRETRDYLQRELKNRGIPSMVYYPKCMHQQGAFASLPYVSPCLVAKHLCDVVLSLPMHPYLAEESIDQICSAITEVLEGIMV